MPIPDDDSGGGGFVQSLRRAEISELRGDVERIERRLDEESRHLGNLREEAARVAGEMKHLVRAYERQAELANEQAMSELEVRKSTALAEIKERSLAAKHNRMVWRGVVFKLLAIASGGGGLLWAMLKARC
jgi:multidrug resistance efflux pump